MKRKIDLAASVRARLLDRARATGTDFQRLLTRFCFERLLYRIGQSPLRDRFVLKGAMLLDVWSERPYRATVDLDLLRRGEGSAEAILGDLRSILDASTEPDGILFDVGSIRTEPIRVDDEYVGTRVRLTARCGTARLLLQIDLGFGDSVWPPPRKCTYPTLLDLPSPEVLAYPREAVVAEKLEAIVVLGDGNSRIKDFFDLHHLATSFEFDRATLSEAVSRTFARRNTRVGDEDPVGLTPAYWENPSRPAQVRAFARRAGITVPETFADDCTSILRTFLLPIVDELRGRRRVDGTWLPGGPWR